MAKKTIEMVVEKQLKWHRTQVILLWLIGAVGVFLMPTGIAAYFNVGKLPITQYIFAITRKNVMVDQVRMLYDLSRGLGIAYSLSGIAVTVLALNRLSLGKSAYRMATFIRKGGDQIRRIKNKPIAGQHLFFGNSPKFCPRYRALSRRSSFSTFSSSEFPFNSPV